MFSTVLSAGAEIAQFDLAGDFTSSMFDITSGTAGSVEITDPKLTIQPPGSATAFVANNETLDIVAPEPGRVIFNGSDGTLMLSDPAAFTGAIRNFSAGNAVDLPELTFNANTTLGYSGTPAGGTVTVTNGSQTAAFALLGNYMAASFVTAADGHGGTVITDASQTADATVAPHHHHG